MLKSTLDNDLIQDIQHNCNISDARDHGIYSMCTMVLKLRNLYKWERGIQPWEEPESVDLLDWIEAKENYWAEIVNDEYRPLRANTLRIDPDDPVEFYDPGNGTTLLYGAGYGRSMKAVFFLAEVLEQREVEGCQVHILGTERAKEMSSPFAMVQDGDIIIRKEPLRYFLWDHIQELRTSCRASLRHALETYGVLLDGSIDKGLLQARFSAMVEEEMDLFIHHEVGEILQKTFNTKAFRAFIARYPGSIVEFVCRALKDTLADTHPKGPLSYIVREQRKSTLSLYLGFVDGLRKKLFPEIFAAWQLFLQNDDWGLIEDAREECRKRILELAGTAQQLSQMIDVSSDKRIQNQFFNEIVLPLGLEIPQMNITQKQ